MLAKHVRRPQKKATRTQRFPIGGGLDVVSPANDVRPGRALAMANFEPYFSDGYRRCHGFERYDGRPQPHLQTFVGFSVDTVAGLVAGTTILTGDSSGETGLVVDFDVETLSVALTKLSGSLIDGESFNSGAYNMTNSVVLNQAPTDNLEKQYRLATEDEYRGDIEAIPGVNEPRGAWSRGANVYGIRDNVGETAAVLHLATTGGWVTAGITMAQYLFFNTGGGGGGNALPEEGDTVNGETSGETATVHRVIVHAGATATNDASGYLVLTSVSGAFSDAENIRIGVTVVAVSSGASQQFSFPIGGVYEFINYNFFGGTDTYRTYGCNGVGPAFEIDENNIVSPILFPLTELENQPEFNTPYLIEEHKNHLFLAVPGGRFMHTSPGLPLTFNGFLFAGDFAIGDEITGMDSVTGDILAVTSQRGTQGLSGTDVTNWELGKIGEKTGGLLYSTQTIDTVYGINDLGVTSLARTDSFGNFAGATVSQLIQPLVNRLRDSLNDTTIVRESNQYRMYFDDGSCLVMYVPDVGSANQARVETNTRTRVHFGYLFYPKVVKKIYNTEDENGNEVSYFLSDDGYLYKDRVGRNFDGESIEAYVRLVFNNINTPTIIKRIRRAFLEMDADDNVEIKVNYDFDYGDSGKASGQTTIDVFGGGALWDDGLWDVAKWDAQLRSSPKININGSGENIGIVFSSDSAVNEPFILQGLNVHYEPRRLRR